MNQNVQIPLEANTGLCIQLESGGTSVWTIEKVIGYGGSSVVYRATQKSGRFAGRTGIVKEFYPQSLSRISRESGALIIPEEDKAEFESKKEHFFEGFSSREQFSVLDSDHAMALPHIFGEANNTWYAVSDENTGCTLSDFDRRELSLNRAAQIMYSLCSAIGALHERGYLYLDLKPDNINIYSLDGREHIRLFDFDTVQSKKKLREAKYSTYSDGWAPPEQKAWRVKDISERTDIYSLGAVFFWLLTGRKPVGDTYGDESTDNDIKRIKEETFDWRQFPLCADASDGVIELVQRIFRKTLNTASTRYDSVAKMKGDLSELINRTGGNPAVEKLLLQAKVEAKVDLADAKQSIEQTIKKNSIKSYLFGSKKRTIITASVFVALALLAGVFSVVGGRLTEQVLPGKSTGIQQTVDDHLLLTLSNANHQYEVGLENWRRLDYNRADRDIHAARDEISRQHSQAELDVARVNNSLGCLYLDMGKYQEAYDYLNSAYVSFRGTLGDSSIEARAVRASIARYYFNTGKLEEALTETQYILDHSDSKIEPAIVAATLHLRAEILDAQGRYDQAIALYEQVLEMYGDISSDGKMSEQLANYANDPKLSQSEKDYYTNAVRWIALTYNNIAMVNNHKGDAEAAIAAANTGIELSLSNVYIGRRNLTTSRLYMNLAIAEGSRGNTDKALDDIDLAMRIQRNLFDFEDVFPGLVEVYDVYGDLLMARGKNDAAKPYYEGAVELALSSFGENHPDTAAAYDALAMYCHAMDDSETALDYLKKAIEIRKNLLAENHPDTAGIYCDLAIVERKIGDAAAAKENLLRAKEICENWEIEGALSERIKTALEQGAEE